MEQTLYMSVGEKLRQLRKSRGETLQVIAAKTEMSMSYLSDIERNRTLPTLRMLDRITLHYGLTLAAFFENVTIFNDLDD